jgi:hypothetical protein
MRKISTVAVLVGLALGVGAPARADDKDDAKAILDKAIKALGGEEKLSTFKAATWKGKGKVFAMDNEIEYSGEWAVQAPDRLRVVIKGEFMGQAFKRTQVLNGDKAYSKTSDEDTMTRDKDGVAESKRDFQMLWIPATILPLRGKAFKLETLGDEKIGDTPAVGLKVTGPGGKDFRIYFDKKTRLPIKMAAKVKAMGGEEVDQEWLYSDFKEVQGIKKAMTVELKRDGKKFIEQKISDFKPAEKLDDKLFEKP